MYTQKAVVFMIFLSTPSGWRATRGLRGQLWTGDDFYPRPPGGGRRENAFDKIEHTLFLSTPSGWRATMGGGWLGWVRFDFYPRPPGGGRRFAQFVPCVQLAYFYPRPPGGGRPGPASPTIAEPCISIHALRVEGDSFGISASKSIVISIHALRVEGDAATIWSASARSSYFYPRPPGGGRPTAWIQRS